MMIPILIAGEGQRALNPSLLQYGSNEAESPNSFFQVSRPSDVGRFMPSAISENRELAVLLMTINLF